VYGSMFPAMLWVELELGHVGVQMGTRSNVGYDK